jgi:hypothetical protein
MMHRIRHLFNRRSEMRGGLTVLGLMLVPLVAVSIYALVHDQPKSTVRPTDGDPPAQTRARGHQITQEEYLNLPGSAGHLDAQGNQVETETAPVPPMPKVDGIGVTGGEDWSNRTSAVRNGIRFAKDMSQINPAKPQPTFARMRSYMASGALETAKGMVDAQASAGAKAPRPKLQYLFLYESPQTGAQTGKLVYRDQTYLTVEFAPDGRILVLYL